MGGLLRVVFQPVAVPPLVFFSGKCGVVALLSLFGFAVLGGLCFIGFGVLGGLCFIGFGVLGFRSFIGFGVLGFRSFIGFGVLGVRVFKMHDMVRNIKAKKVSE